MMSTSNAPRAEEQNDPHTCPLPSNWRQWDMFGPHRFNAVTDEEGSRCEHARRLALGSVASVRQPTWRVEPAPVEDTGPRRMHTELIVAGRRLHIDVITGTRYGPGRSFIEYRIYIDGRLEGRGGFCGCSLGFGGGERDAVAHVTDQLVVRVEGSSGGGLQHGLEQPPVIAVSRVASVWRRALTS